MKVLKFLIPALMMASPGYGQGSMLNRDVMACGGGVSSTLFLRGNCTLGQPISGESASTGFTLKSGFWKGGGTAGSGCDYAVGDVNASGNYNGLDVTYGVAYFKGGNPPLCDPCPSCPDWYYCGDVNGSCSYNGLDITYGVAYLKGGPGLLPCGDCAAVAINNFHSGNIGSSGKNKERQLKSIGSTAGALLILETRVDAVGNVLTVNVNLSCEEPLAFICIPLKWESDDISPKEITTGDVLSKWDMAWSRIYAGKKQLLLLGWSDLGGEANPLLETKGNTINLFQISFVLKSRTPQPDYKITPAIDEINGDITLGLEDGIRCIKPEIVYEETASGSAKPIPDLLPDSYSLKRNYPNPFNAGTTIEYALPEPSYVTMEIYDLLGRKVTDLVNGDQPAGYYRITWDASGQTSGMYFYAIKAGDFREIKKMLLVK